MRTQVDVWLRRLIAKYRFASLLLVLGISALQPLVASAQTCLQATPGTYQWQNAALAPQSGVFNYYVNATPQQANEDALVALSQGPASTWTDLAVIVRFGASGWIDARDGDTYRQIYPHYAGETNRLRLTVDVVRKKFSVWRFVDDAGRWVLIANDFNFRSEQQGVTQLDNFSLEAEVGGVDACVEDPQTWAQATPGAAQWQNNPLPYSTTTSASYQDYLFFIRPQTANADALVALSNGPQASWGNLAAIVRFNTNNTIDVRNGDLYQADVPIGYAANATYRVLVHVSLSTHTYSVYVAPIEGAYTRIATDYRFRTEQQGVTQLDTWVTEAEQGAIAAHVESSPFYQ